MNLKRKVKRAVVLLFMSTICMYSFAQNHVVSGVITDIGGEAMVGVNVVEKGVASNGTISNADGKFSISNLNSNSVLVFSFIGYTRQ
ncbi:TonB-dependent receptor SusC, partial [termite gut metagenome]